MKTFWLYYNGCVLTSVRALENSDDHYVRFLAQSWHQRVPLCHPDYAPFEFAQAIAMSEVRL